MIPLPFARGEFGEILPPPLIHTPVDTPSSMLDQLLDAAPNLRLHLATSIETLAPVALLYHQQTRLRDVIGGSCRNDAELALYVAVVIECQPLSLRPLGDERARFATFKPVLRRIGGELGGRLVWQVGGPEGRGATYEMPDPAVAVVRAQTFFVEWAEEETSRATFSLRQLGPAAEAAYGL
jgi:hypothetical protein